MKDDICIHCKFYRKKTLKGRIISEKCTNKDYDNSVHFKRCGADYCAVTGKEKFSWSHYYLRRL